MIIRTTTQHDLESILTVQREAFGEETEAELTSQLLADPSSSPLISLLAIDPGNVAIGHILLTRATVTGHPDVPAMLLAPLAVVPEHQRQGIGSELSKQAIQAATSAGTALVFVFGDPNYYVRHGFRSRAQDLGFEPPYPIDKQYDDAWMVQELAPGTIGSTAGQIEAAPALMHPQLWQE